MNIRMRNVGCAALLVSVAIVFVAETAVAEDWANWRGPEQNGISRETGLIDRWSYDNKENVLWESDIGGRATPIVMDDRVYLNCRTHHDFNIPDEKIHCREQVVCWDAKTGAVLWKDEFNVFQTDIPAPRVGWAAMCGDPETKQVYLHSVDGILRCYTADGKVVWERSLLEEYGHISGYGGRTQTPIIDEDRVIVSFLAANWGESKGPGPKQYYYAFDKRNGDLLWVSAPGDAPYDTNYSVPIVAVIDGVRMLIGGNANGNVYAMYARTGEKIWEFKFSLRGLNASPATDGNYVYISHGEDNIDSQEFGRVQCINAIGKGDITKTNSVWMVDGLKSGYTALLVHDGILYVVTDTGNLHAFDSKDGTQLWVHNLGTVGKGSPVWADGKLYVMEVNGNIHILKPSREGCETLSRIRMTARNGNGVDEIYASPAISNGRIFFVTRDRTICVGKKDAAASDAKPIPLPEEKAATGKIASLQLRPFEVVLELGIPVKYTLVAFDENGREIKRMAPTLTAGDGLDELSISGDTVTATKTDKDFAGELSATEAGLTAHARVRNISSAKIWKWDFTGFKGVQVPPTWLRAFAKLKPVDVNGNTALQVAGMGKAPGRPSHTVFIGTPDMSNYTIQADVMMKEDRRQLPDIGVVANRYNFILKGNLGKIRMQSWAPHLRMAQEKKFTSEPEVWYTMKMKVDVTDSEAKVKGKIWKQGEKEPAEWSLEAIDPHPNKTGSPGLYVYSITDCLFDNVSVTFDDR